MHQLVLVPSTIYSLFWQVLIFFKAFYLLIRLLIYRHLLVSRGFISQLWTLVAGKTKSYSKVLSHTNFRVYYYIFLLADSILQVSVFYFHLILQTLSCPIFKKSFNCILVIIKYYDVKLILTHCLKNRVLKVI